jgi:hypothetical protein
MFGKWFGDWFHLWFGGTTPPFGLELPTDTDFVAYVRAVDRINGPAEIVRSVSAAAGSRTATASEASRSGDALTNNRSGAV